MTDKAKPKVGFTCGAFDLLHAGHCLMLKEAKEQCDYLIVGLQTDPSEDESMPGVDRSDKKKPVQSVEERRIQLEAVKYVDKIVEYHTEADLYQLLKKLKPDIRIIGADWKGKKYTGYDLDIPVYFNTRSHTYSTSELRNRVLEATNKKT